jgi:hypothetical protein
MKEMFRIWRLVKLISAVEDQLIEDSPQEKYSEQVYTDLIIKDMVKHYGYSHRTVVKILGTAEAKGYITRKMPTFNSTERDLSTCYVTRDKGFHLISGPVGFIDELANANNGFMNLMLSSLGAAAIIAILGLISGLFSAFIHWIANFPK